MYEDSDVMQEVADAKVEVATYGLGSILGDQDWGKDGGWSCLHMGK